MHTHTHLCTHTNKIYAHTYAHLYTVYYIVHLCTYTNNARAHTHTWYNPALYIVHTSQKYTPLKHTLTRSHKCTHTHTLFTHSCHIIHTHIPSLYPPYTHTCTLHTHAHCSFSLSHKLSHTYIQTYPSQVLYPVGLMRHLEHLHEELVCRK